MVDKNTTDSKFDLKNMKYIVIFVILAQFASFIAPIFVDSSKLGNMSSVIEIIIALSIIIFIIYHVQKHKSTINSASQLPDVDGDKKIVDIIAERMESQALQENNVVQKSEFTGVTQHINSTQINAPKSISQPKSSTMSSNSGLYIFMMLAGVLILVKTGFEYFSSSLPSYVAIQIGIGVGLALGGLKMYRKSLVKNNDPFKNNYDYLKK